MDGSIPQKTCSKCSKTYPATTEYFHRCGDGLKLYCKECARERRKRYYELNADKLREYQKCYREENADKERERLRRYREENHDKELEREKRYREENRDKLRERAKRYREENLGKIRKREKRYREENPEKRQESVKRYCEGNREKIQESAKRYREENPEKIRASLHRRRAHLANADGAHTAADIETQVASQTKNGKLYCWWCGKPIKRKYHIDHRIPLAKGGSNDPGNLCITHAKCNLSKNDKMPWEFNGRLL